MTAFDASAVTTHESPAGRLQRPRLMSSRLGNSLPCTVPMYTSPYRRLHAQSLAACEIRGSIDPIGIDMDLSDRLPVQLLSCTFRIRIRLIMSRVRAVPARATLDRDVPTATRRDGCMACAAARRGAAKPTGMWYLCADGGGVAQRSDNDLLGRRPKHDAERRQALVHAGVSPWWLHKLDCWLAGVGSPARHHCHSPPERHGNHTRSACCR